MFLRQEPPVNRPVCALVHPVPGQQPSLPRLCMQVAWIKPGEDAARAALESFLSKSRMGLYEGKRNDPGIPQALSGMSPYLHYGQIAPQRCALEATRYKRANPGAAKAADGFLEELVVRRELSDNFCHYEPRFVALARLLSAPTEWNRQQLQHQFYPLGRYDSLDAAADWARDTLDKHTADEREFLYSREQLEKAQTHDDLWNAAQASRCHCPSHVPATRAFNHAACAYSPRPVQLEMVHLGKMHGFMRMYWCKKILEWTARPAEALATAIYLNDK